MAGYAKQTVILLKCVGNLVSYSDDRKDRLSRHVVNIDVHRC